MESPGLETSGALEKAFKMMDELIKAFAKDNFGSHYRVAPQGQNKTIQPLTLIVKKHQSWFKNVAKPAPKIVLEKLECFLKDDHPNLRENLQELVKYNLRNGPVIKTNKGAFAATNKRMEVGVTEHLKVGVTKQHELGELNLGNLQEEFYRDTGLREILKKAFLDPTKIRPFQKEKLYIITGVVYSDKLRVTGDRRSEDTIDAEAKISMPFIEWIENLAPALRAVVSKVRTPAPPIAKTQRSPLLFTYAKVEYNQDENRLQLKRGEFVGAKLGPQDAVADGEKSPTDDGTEDDELTAEDLESDVEFVELEKDRDEISILQDLCQCAEDHPKETLQVMVNFLHGTSSRQEMRTRATLFLRTVNYVLKSSSRSMRTEVPLSAKDKQFMISTGLTIGQQEHNASKIIQVSNENIPTVRNYGLVFQHLQEINDEEWDALKECARELVKGSQAGPS